MYTIGELCKKFNLSRSALLYYDSIGLLKAAERTKSNYRVYSESDKSRLKQICLYRDAGVTLEQIKELLDSNEDNKKNVLKRRLIDLNNEMYLLRLQQKIIVEILKGKNTSSKELMMDKDTFVSVLKSSGVREEILDDLHIEFERRSPEKHQIFLEFLGIGENEIRDIRDKAQKDNRRSCMSDFLKIEDFIELSDEGYEEAIVQFLQDNEITIDDFKYVGKCDSECPQCDAESFRVWRRDLGFIKEGQIFTFDIDAADETLDFAIYWCNKCGKWTTYIE